MNFRALPWIFLAALVGGGATFWWWGWRWQARVERSQDEPIRAAALRYGVEPTLVKAIVWRESRFNPAARGRAQEIGLMQLREEAAHEWAEAEKIETFQHEHCVDPLTNTLAGTFYLRKLLIRYRRTDDPLPYALADYNAGRANVLKWLRNSPEAATNSVVFIERIGFPSTKDYVRSVIRRQAYYRSVWGRLRSDAPSMTLHCQVDFAINAHEMNFAGPIQRDALPITGPIKPGGVRRPGGAPGLQNQRGTQQSPGWVRFPSTSATF